MSCGILGIVIGLMGAGFAVIGLISTGADDASAFGVYLTASAIVFGCGLIAAAIGAHKHE